LLKKHHRPYFFEVVHANIQPKAWGEGPNPQKTLGFVETDADFGKLVHYA
jgi:hypothetical protein